jgi:crotonobetainyl-CoA hydratase/dehydration protein DpgD
MLVRLADAWQDERRSGHPSILRGADDKAFCAARSTGSSADAGPPPAGDRLRPARPADTPSSTRACCGTTASKPIIAQVHGFAVAGGTEILSCTDIRVASEDALFGLAEVK